MRLYRCARQVTLAAQAPALCCPHLLLPSSNWCRQCFLVSCDPVDVSDGNGGTLQRKTACKDPDREILVEVTDT